MKTIKLVVTHKGQFSKKYDDSDLKKIKQALRSLAQKDKSQGIVTHIVHLDDSRVEVNDEGRPAVIEVLCDECETALKFEEFDDAVRKEMLLTLGAR